ncbi:MAG: hypothetical protein JNJ54_30960 [Myxococcaceae bacterium]|nr:hypothetical protein [Myxococcaceae bacterium]
MRPVLGALLLLCSSPALASSLLVVAENDPAREVIGELVEPFGKAKVKLKVAGPQAPASQCLNKGNERNRCLAQAAETAFVEAVLLIKATTAKGRTTVTFQMLDSDEGKLIKREVATGPATNLGGALKPVIARLAKVVKARKEKVEPQPAPDKPDQPKADPPKVDPPKVDPLKADPYPTTPSKTEPVAVKPEPKPDTPTKTNLEPVVVTPPEGVVAPVQPKGSGLTVAAWTTTGLAVAAAGVAGTFGALGFTTAGELGKNEAGVSPLSRSQANALAAQANTNYTVALGAGIGAGVLGVVSAILWSQTP